MNRDISHNELINNLMRFKKIELIEALEEIFLSTWDSSDELSNQFIYDKIKEIIKSNNNS